MLIVIELSLKFVALILAWQNSWKVIYWTPKNLPSYRLLHAVRFRQIAEKAASTRQNEMSCFTADGSLKQSD